MTKIHSIARISRKRHVLVAGAVLVAALIGGCESPMAYSDAPSLSASARLAYDDRTYALNHVGGEAQAHAADATWTTERTYVYRGGRDPVTGRATTQM